MKKQQNALHSSPLFPVFMNHRIVSWAIFIVLCIIWGSSFILMKYSTDGLDALQIAAVRIFSGGIVFLPFAVIHLRKIPRNKAGLVILAGLTGNLIPAFLFAWAIEKNIDSSLAGILNALTPICVAVIGILFYKDRVVFHRLIGVFIGFTGVCLLTLTQQHISLHYFGYAMLIVLGTVLYGMNVNLVSHRLYMIEPLHLATVSLAILTLPSGLVLWQQNFFQLDFDNRVVQVSVGASVLLGIVGSSLATFLFYLLVKMSGGLFASLVTYGIPFVAVFWGMLDGEMITATGMISLGIILLGVYLTNRREKNK
jgi:drug/metabolite transporter (DMT)-like permease